MNLHTFPSFGISTQGALECKIESKFKRFNQSDTFNDLTANQYNCLTYEEMYQREIEAAEKQGYDQGYLKGLSDGAIAGKKEIDPVIQKLGKAFDEVNQIKTNLSKYTEIEAVNLSIAIAKKIVGNEISINKNVILNIVKEALKKVDGHETIKIKVNPTENHILEENKIDIKKIAGCVQNIEIICDEHIALGGCIVETNIGDIDARIEKQFQVIEDAFKLDCL